jgi:hypothetical protein
LTTPLNEGIEITDIDQRPPQARQAHDGEIAVARQSP